MNTLFKKLSGAIFSMAIVIMTTSKAFAEDFGAQLAYGVMPLRLAEPSLMEKFLLYGWKIVIPVAIVLVGAIILLVRFIGIRKNRK